MIRSSVDEYPSLMISRFNINGVPIPVGHHLCISGYESHTSCGEATIVDAHVSLQSLRPGIIGDTYRRMIRANIPSSNRDVGGTVFINEIHNGTLYTLVLGILTSDLRKNRNSSGNVVIQQLWQIINFAPAQDIFESLLYIDLNIYGQLQQ
ncbi:hypothetical protein C2G38_2075251 [Gigaspora rosea]|uniref:Uncharacterized protein n=1 Tax=Gigaspora rosea TaxID=44941 RepID=A0A397VKQ4_9GLOM|nr:hypothetical protein C2G38_2075251 [Gigaspora rosea]